VPFQSIKPDGYRSRGQLLHSPGAHEHDGTCSAADTALAVSSSSGGFCEVFIHQTRSVVRQQEATTSLSTSASATDRNICRMLALTRELSCYFAITGHGIGQDWLRAKGTCGGQAVNRERGPHSLIDSETAARAEPVCPDRVLDQQSERQFNQRRFFLAALRFACTGFPPRPSPIFFAMADLTLA
jgi:hypothetical protein